MYVCPSLSRCAAFLLFTDCHYEKKSTCSRHDQSQVSSFGTQLSVPCLCSQVNHTPLLAQVLLDVWVAEQVESLPLRLLCDASTLLCFLSFLALNLLPNLRLKFGLGCNHRPSQVASPVLPFVAPVITWAMPRTLT